MNWRCLFGHRTQTFAPLYSRCVRCKTPFFTDYFASRELGRVVRIRITEEEANRAAPKRNAQLLAALGSQP